jgi:hypothetical protein
LLCPQAPGARIRALGSPHRRRAPSGASALRAAVLLCPQAPGARIRALGSPEIMVPAFPAERGLSVG